MTRHVDPSQTPPSGGFGSADNGVDFGWVRLVLHRAVASLRPVLDQKDQIAAALDVGIVASGVAGHSDEQAQRIQLSRLLKRAVGFAAADAELALLEAESSEAIDDLLARILANPPRHHGITGTDASRRDPADTDDDEHRDDQHRQIP